jgi:hypothetical protein
MGLEYTFNSKLQGERLAAEEKRQLRITEIEQQGATVRLDKQIGAENIRGDRAFRQSEMQFGENMKKLDAQIEQARVSNDTAKLNALTAQRNAATAEKTGASQVELDKERMNYYRSMASTKADGLDQKGLLGALGAAKERHKTFSTALTKAQGAAMGSTTPEVQDLMMKVQEADTQIKTYQDRLTGGGETKADVSGDAALGKHSEKDQKMMARVAYADNLVNLNEHPEVYTNDKMYEKFRRMAIQKGASREEMDTLNEAYADGKAVYLLKQYEDETKRAGNRTEDGDSIVTRAFKRLSGK